MNKFNGILTTLALALSLTACGFEGPDAETAGGSAAPADQTPPQKDGTGGSAGATETDGGAGAPAPAGGGGGAHSHDTDAGMGGMGTDAGSGGSPPVTTDAGTGGSAGDSGSGGEGGTDSGTGGSDAGSVPAQPDPVVVTGSCAMKFSTAYVGNSSTAEIRGNLPGATWSSGPAITDTNADKYLEYSTATIGTGMYDLTYMVPPSTWANLGDSTALKAMTPAAREFILCNWWDAGAGKTVSVANPSCNIRISVGSGCTITPYGNMKDYK